MLPPLLNQTLKNKNKFEESNQILFKESLLLLWMQ